MLITDITVSFRNPTVSHDYSRGGETLRWHLRIEGTKTEAVCGWFMLFASRNIWHRKQESGYKGE